jgi:hypothetical protein
MTQKIKRGTGENKGADCAPVSSLPGNQPHENYPEPESPPQPKVTPAEA